MKNALLRHSFEAIDVQTHSLLAKELAIHTQAFLDLKSPDKKQFKEYSLKLSKSIKAHSGIYTAITLSNSNVPNAYVIIPQIDRNHPLLVDYYREVTTNQDGLKQIKKGQGVFEGAIDRGKSRVSGGFSEFMVKMGITRGLMQQGFTAEEISAIILHELGHVFTYFEYLGTNITASYVLQHVSRELLGTREVKRKYKIIQEGSDALGIQIEDPDALAHTQNETVIQTVLLREVVKKRYSEMDSTTYDMTAWEMLSDQFATRHGAGRALVTALDKMYRTHRLAEYKDTKGYLMTEAFKLLLFIISIPLTFAIVPFLLLVVIDPNEDLYDKPKSRLARIQRDMIDASKNRDTDADYRKQLVEDIEVIDKIMAEMEERRTLLEMFWITLRPRTRHNYQQMRFQQELEMLVNNSLFVKSAKLNTLSL